MAFRLCRSVSGEIQRMRRLEKPLLFVVDDANMVSTCTTFLFSTIMLYHILRQILSPLFPLCFKLAPMLEQMLRAFDVPPAVFEQ